MPTCCFMYVFPLNLYLFLFRFITYAFRMILLFIILEIYEMRIYEFVCVCVCASCTILQNLLLLRDINIHFVHNLHIHVLSFFHRIFLFKIYFTLVT